VFGLDFTGHGGSSIPKGGGYTAEALMGDADAALAHLGTATLVGRGLGAYIALLLAGARPAEVRGAVLADGPGLAGGGPAPGSPTVLLPEPNASGPPDPFALVELARDLRPPEYAQAFITRAAERAVMDPPFIVSAVARPPWLAAVTADPRTQQFPLLDAVRAYANAVSRDL
jgi:pimeloyl-ACP methyl ester carboxylesterase